MVTRMTAAEQNGLKGVVVKTDQGYFCLDANDQFVSWELLHLGASGICEIQLAESHLDPSSRVLVVGAHIGTIAIPLSRICGELVAVEANPASCERLRLNVLLNERGNIRIIHAAANDLNGTIEFLMNTRNSGGSKRMPKFRDAIYFDDSPQIVTVPASRLDDILDHAFDLVFMDIEGSEYFAFVGMQRILAHARTLVVEFLPHHLSRVGGITVDDFLAPLASHFDHLTIPTMRRTVARGDFRSALGELNERYQGDPAIVFRKSA
jgi:FkbM family methyltransferase